MASDFSTLSWAKGAPIYEVNLRQYGTDSGFQQFEQHLPRLKDMGIEILWFMPVTPISEVGRQGSLGSYYACSSYVQTNPEYGSIEDFTRMVKAAQDNGLKVIIDWVANHTGHDHEWTKSNPEWYYKNEQGNFFDRNGWNDVFDLDYGQKAMREEMIRSMKFWVETCGIDGFRCDMAHLVPLDFWVEARTELDALKLLYWLAESEDHTYHKVFDTSYAWQFMHESERQAKMHITIEEVRVLVDKYNSLPADCHKLYFTTNHDENSWNGTEYEKYGKYAKAYGVLTALLPGNPLVYSGQEIPNKRRLAFFDKDPIVFTGQYHLHDLYKTVFALRKQLYTDGELTMEWVHTTEDHNVMSFVLKSPVRQALVAVKLAGLGRVTVDFSTLHEGRWLNIFSGRETSSGQLQVEMQEGDWAVFVSATQANS